jgi:hypothetical protein
VFLCASLQVAQLFLEYDAEQLAFLQSDAVGKEAAMHAVTTD